MTIAVLGGLDRLKKSYEKQGKCQGMEVRVFPHRVPNLSSRLTNVQGIVVFTGTIAHPLVKEASQAARKHGIPVFHSHSSGVSSFKRCLQELGGKGGLQ